MTDVYEIVAELRQWRANAREHIEILREEMDELADEIELRRRLIQQAEERIRAIDTLLDDQS